MMIKDKGSKKLLISTLSLFCVMFLHAETFRVSKLRTVQISPDYTDATVNLGINESVSIELPEDKTYIEGLELKMDIPESVAYWIDSVACSVYNNIKPFPTSDQIDYSGTRAYVSTLPGKLSWILQIPFVKDNSLKVNQYTTKMDTIFDISQNFVFVRLQPIMKGIPEETLNAIIPITIKPILTNKGKLEVNLSSNDSELQPCTFFVDDQMINLSAQNDILLETGIHNITIVSESYRNEVRTVRIDQAKKTVLSVEMKSIEPTLLIITPDGTSVILDGEPCNELGVEIPVSEGEHKIQFKIGDYAIVRTVNVIKGKTYTVNFTVDLNITEE